MNDPQTPLPTITYSEDIEDMDAYEDPFVTFSWQHWLEMQAQMLQRFARFQRAIGRRQPKLAMLIAVEMQQMVLEWQREASEWVSIVE